jgi:Flp pilus assembly CpaE family ATPase
MRTLRLPLGSALSIAPYRGVRAAEAAVLGLPLVACNLETLRETPARFPGALARAERLSENFINSFLSRVHFGFSVFADLRSTAPP